MELTPITAVAPAASRSLAPSPDESGVGRVRDGAREKESTPPLPIIGSSVTVELDRHAATGVHVVTLIDKRNGKAINQLPAQQVLDAASDLTEMVKTREAAQ